MAHYICTCGVDHPTSEGRIICGMEHRAEREEADRNVRIKPSAPDKMRGGRTE
jgi:hypothetical protein